MRIYKAIRVGSVYSKQIKVNCRLEKNEPVIATIRYYGSIFKLYCEFSSIIPTFTKSSSDYWCGAKNGSRVEVGLRNRNRERALVLCLQVEFSQIIVIWLFLALFLKRKSAHDNDKRGAFRIPCGLPASGVCRSIWPKFSIVVPKMGRIMGAPVYYLKAAMCLLV